MRKPLDETEIFAKIQQYLGLRYLYETGESYTRNREMRDNRHKTKGIEVWEPEEIETIPANLVASLEEAVEIIDMEMINSAIVQLRGHNMALADTLTGLAKDFRYDEIAVLLQQLQEIPIEK